ncbi:MAG: metal ABC transporter substrate-binding protein [Clostridiales Family XIII bacterium]|nr:metal ABC transporter substrate-binding protein [Clostridiales Family XIII bacterium]
MLVPGFALSGCGTEKDAAAGDGKLNVVATIFPEYDFARAVSGGAANVSMLIAPGAGVHSFEPAPGDIKTIQKADVFIYVGGESDEWANDLLDSLDTSEMKIVRLIDCVNAVPEELKEGMTPEEDEAEGAADGETAADAADETEYDEHVWVSPKNALLLIDAIMGAMRDADPANAGLYAENASAYKTALEEVDQNITEVVSSAKRGKIVVADKFPFRYFVDHYGLDYAAAFPGCSDQADAGAATIAYLINTVQDENIPYVYYVELSNQSVADSISEQTGAGTLLLNSCENITKADFESGVTYVDLMKANIENLRKGLN